MRSTQPVEEVIPELFDPDAIQKIANTIDKAARAAEAVFSGPLTEECMLLLIKHRCADRRLSVNTIRDVLQAAARIKTYIKQPEKKGAH